MTKDELMERLKKAEEKKAAERKAAVEKFRAAIKAAHNKDVRGGRYD